MRRVLLCLCLALAATLLVAAPASAGRRWCAKDPIVTLNGRDVQVWVAIPAEYVHLVNGPIDIQFKTPVGINRSVVFTDGGFNGHGEVVTFSDDPQATISPQGSFNVRIWVSVPIDAVANASVSKIPTQITIIEGDKATVLHGWNTGSWVTTRVNDGAK